MLRHRLASQNVAARIFKESAALSSRVMAVTQARSLSSTDRSQKSLVEEAETFNNMLRKWNPQAYQQVDQEHQMELEREEKTAFARKMRQWNSAAYAQVDKETKEAVQRAADAKGFNVREVKGVFWTDAHGREHVHKIVKPKPGDNAPA